MIRPATVLTESEIVTLVACARHAPHPRQRRRAQAVLAHSRGLPLPRLAHVFAVSYQTAHGWLQAWERYGVAGLAEGHRSGRPSKRSKSAPEK